MKLEGPSAPVVRSKAKAIASATTFIIEVTVPGEVSNKVERFNGVPRSYLSRRTL